MINKITGYELIYGLSVKLHFQKLEWAEGSRLWNEEFKENVIGHMKMCVKW